jgi:hypothetical protein
MSCVMDSPSETSQHADVMAHAMHQLDASMERVRQARERFTEASHHLAQTRQAMEQDPHVERVRRARALLDAENHRWAHIPCHNAVEPATDD